MEMNHSMPCQAMSMKTASASQATSPSDAALFNQLFNVTDKNRSGDINVQEFGDLLEYSRQQSGMTGGPIRGEIVQQLHKQADTSGDGALSQEEFAQFLDSAMSEGTSSTASPMRQPMEADSTTGTMIDPTDTAEETQGANHQCGCNHNAAASTEQASTTVAAIAPASSKSNSMDFLATNITPITPSKPEENHSAH